MMRTMRFRWTWARDERVRARLERAGWTCGGHHAIYRDSAFMWRGEGRVTSLLAHIRRLWQGLVVALTWRAR
jgi:hypothetical protein